MKPNVEKPNIFTYQDYRLFLKHAHTAFKKSDPRFSHRYIAARTGTDAGCFAKIISGARNIPHRLILKFAELFQLNRRETEYFQILILFNHAKTHAERDGYFQKLGAFKESRIKELTSGYYEYFANWYVVAIRELLNFYPFSGNFEELAQMLHPPITVAEAKRAVELLLRLNLITRTAHGRYAQTDALLSTGYEHAPLAATNYFLKTLELCREAVDRFDRNDRNLSSITLSTSEAHSAVVQEKLRAFRRELMEEIKKVPKAQRVYQLNISIFPVSRTYGGHNE